MTVSGRKIRPVGTGEVESPVSPGVAVGGRFGISPSSRASSGGGPVTPPFSPTDVANLSLWLDASYAPSLFQASDGTTAAASDGDRVGYWGDRSGNANHATLLNFLEPPLPDSRRATLKLSIRNGKNVLRWDGVDDLLILGTPVAAVAFTLFCVFKKRATGVNAVPLGGDNTTGVMGYNDGTYYVINDSAQFPGNAHLETASFQLGTWRMASGAGGYVTRQNGVQLTSTGNAGMTTLRYVGGRTFGNYHDGDIAAILLYGRALTDQEVLQVETYLQAEFATPVAGDVTEGLLTGDPWILRPEPMATPRGGRPLILFAHGAGADEKLLDIPELAAVLSALTAAGYMVASGYYGGDNWGNDAGVDKLYAMYSFLAARESPSRVIFWGPSMGGCVVQRALADPRFSTVKGAYLNYPVCDLSSMHAAFGAGIDAAWTGYPTGAVSPIDIAGTAFAGKRLRFTHSAADGVVGKAANTDAMRSIVGPYATESGLIVTSGDHGDPSNFDAADFVAFFDRCV